jgi:phytoene dehydrogenase-like protein
MPVDSSDAIVVGAGPNGLAAAVTLARAGVHVSVYERGDTIGGGARTAELTLPGFRHDVCSAVHPMAFASGFFRRFGLDRKVEFAVPDVSYAHPLDRSRAGIAYRDLARTIDQLGRDGDAWGRLMGPLVRHADAVAELTGSELIRIPRDVVTAVRFGLALIEQGSPLWNLRFRDEEAPAMFTGVAAHAIRPMPSLATAGAALSLGTQAHARGWPIPIGGSQSIVDALAADLLAHGGEIHTGAEVTSIDELPLADAVLFDTTPRALLDLAGGRLPALYARAIGEFRYGNAVAKVDYALSGPVPWSNPEVRRSGTVHVGGTRAAIKRSEAEVAAGRHSSDPYVLVSQPSEFDPSRAPEGSHVLWAYTHVPRDSGLDQTEAVTRQIERFAPGFRDVILASSSRTALDLQNYNPNYIGGDIAAGSPSLTQLVRRPVATTDPWRTPAAGIYLCSASTPPGPGVHGLAGYYAARSALRQEFGVTRMPELR